MTVKSKARGELSTEGSIVSVVDPPWLLQAANRLRIKREKTDLDNEQYIGGQI